jgi:transposase
MEKVSIIGLDIAKNVFQVHGVDGGGAVVIRRALRRSTGGSSPPDART